MEKILLVDDNQPIRRMIKRLFADKKYLFHEAETLKGAVGHLEKDKYDLIITDLKLPDGEGIELLKQRNANDMESEIIIITAYGDVETAVKAMKDGAFDFIIKPLNIDEFEIKVEKALEKVALTQDNERLRETINIMADNESEDYNFSEIKGGSKELVEVMELVKKVSHSTAAVLITGESGVGKELVARAIHFNSDRCNKPFVRVNCAVFSEGILESELFGHEKGAFTGAMNKRLGRFEIADGGTIFLDEIGDLPANTQVKLLQVLQEFTFERVGGNVPISIDVRVIAATNKNLQEKILDNTFREDLFYRINVVPVHIPPLRQRTDDIELLTEFFIDKFAREGQDPGNKLTISPEVMAELKKYAWPGNVRELEHIIERMVILCSGNSLEIRDIPVEVIEKRDIPTMKNLDLEGTLKEVLEQYERKIIKYYLEKENYDKQHTAKKLGVKLSTLYNKIDKYGLKGK